MNQEMIEKIADECGVYTDAKLLNFATLIAEAEAERITKLVDLHVEWLKQAIEAK
jgi:hypothetical protein